MNVLVACEFSGIVRDAFRQQGHNAWSCDLLPCEGDPQWHIQDNVLDHLLFAGCGERWDLMIAHPPCQHLAASGAQYWPQKLGDGRQKSAIDFFMALAGADVPHVAIENPVGKISSVWRRPDQIIQPWQFGDAVTKKTCLWLCGLPALEPTNIVRPVAAHCTSSKYGGPRKDGTRRKNPLRVLHGDAHNRSRSFPGIAEAMAEQWGRPERRDAQEYERRMAREVGA